MKDQLTLEDTADSIRLQAAWQQVLKRLSPDVPQAWYERFLKPLRPMSLDGNTVNVAVPGRFIMEWVRERYLGALQGLLADELGHSVSMELHMEARERQPVLATNNISVAAPAHEDRFRPQEKFTFENFVVGQSNRLAVAGAKAVAIEPGVKYNPLFIYGA
ncbi:MAG TPA: DnaA N-terminal domain-containing protein, partial [Fimbriimonadaceae bacterium]|nr:DnaA N-terminal domain-containing protein [Fimbriimonadaceae bacterium]